MAFPALLGLLPYLGSAAAGFAGAKLGGFGNSDNQQQSNGLGSKGNFLTGYPSQIHQLPRYSQGQIGQMNQLSQMGLSGLQGINPSFEPIAQQAREQFGQKGIPSIAERFTNTGPGTASLQRSSAFGQNIGQGYSDLESNLAALGSQHNLSQQGHFRGLAQLGLQPQFDTKIEASSPGLTQTLPGNLAQSLPSLLLLLSQLGYLGGNK